MHKLERSNDNLALFSRKPVGRTRSLEYIDVYLRDVIEIFALLFLRVVERQSCGTLTQGNVAVKNQKGAHSQLNQTSQNQQYQYSPLISLESDPFILEVFHQYPDCLSDEHKVIERINRQEAEKRFIVLSADAVIQEFAMVIELLSTAITSKAMVAVHLDIPIAYHTKSQILRSIKMHQFFICHQSIDRICHCEKDIVVGDDQEEPEGEAQQDPKNSLPNIIQSRDYKHAIEYQLSKEYKECSYLLT